MDKYTEFKDTLDKKYIEPTGVMKSEGVISLGDLISLLEKGFDELKVVMDGSNLKSQINGDRTFMQRFGLFKMKSRSVINNECTSIISNFNNDKCRISFGFATRSRTGSEFVVLIKERGSDELYFEHDFFADKEFADNYVSEIYGMFAVLEDYATYYPNNEKKEVTSIVQKFDDGVLAVTVSVYTDGTVHYSILPSEGTDPDKIFTREWLNRVKLSSYVKDNEVDILENIPVEIASLNDAFRSVVEKELEKAKNLGKSFGMAN